MGTTQRGHRCGGGLYRLANISFGLNSSNTCTSEYSPCSSKTGGTSLNAVMFMMAVVSVFLFLGCWFLHFLFFVFVFFFRFLGLLGHGYLGGHQYPISHMYFMAASSPLGRTPFSSACSILSESSAGTSLDWT